ncbi:MAG TPA: hypothetical protein VN328_11580 [Thermodesulfovibrionales bacterium]|nr:hypothetical protein [Thermodesulfovibrionales bacterium]
MQGWGRIAVLASLICIGLLFLLSMRKSDVTNHPVLGLDRLDVEILEDHNATLEHWIQKGIRSAVLVNIDAHDDMKRISVKETERLSSAYQQRKMAPLTAGNKQFKNFPVTNSNFIRAAAKLGIVSRVYWVVPSTYNLFSDSGNQLVSLLNMYGFPYQDIKTFRMEEGCFIGNSDGIPLSICQIERLPDISEPILLTVDVDFFQEMNNAFGHKFTNSVNQTLSALFKKGYSIRDATVAYSVSGGFLSASHRWVGEMVIDSLRQPGMISQSNLPDYYSVMQRADILLVMKRYDELLNYLLPFADKYGNRPSIPMYLARAYYERGEIERSFHYGEKACLIDKNYCYGLSELGEMILARQGLSSAEKFLARGYSIFPEMDHGQFSYAMALMKSGRYEKAIEYFSVFRNVYGPFPVDFYLAETYLLKRDEASALKYYDTARSELLANPYAIAAFGDVGAIKRAVEFYEKRGYSSHASELKSVMRLSVIGRS